MCIWKTINFFYKILLCGEAPAPDFVSPRTLYLKKCSYFTIRLENVTEFLWKPTYPSHMKSKSFIKLFAFLCVIRANVCKSRRIQIKENGHCKKTHSGLEYRLLWRKLQEFRSLVTKVKGDCRRRHWFHVCIVEHPRYRLRFLTLILCDNKVLVKIVRTEIPLHSYHFCFSFFFV